MAVHAQLSMAQNGRLNGCGIGRLKRYVIGHTAENRISDAFACNIMGYTRFILFIFADIVKKCRGVDDLAVKFELFLEILDPHNASDIQQMVNTVAAEDAPRFQLCNVAQVPPEQTVGTDVINARHGTKRRQARSHEAATRRPPIGLRCKVIDDPHANGPAS